MLRCLTENIEENVSYTINGEQLRRQLSLVFDKEPKDAFDGAKPSYIIFAKGWVYQFIIFDAKYYNIQLEENKKLRGQPGIESITKQYLYQLAYQPFVEEHQIKTVRNCFLMPTNGKDVVVKGTASLAMLSSLGLQDIQIRLLSAETMYKHYIENTKMDIGLLQL